MDDTSGLALAAVVLALGSAAVIAVVHLAGVGRLSRNRFAGIRVPRALASEEAWRTLHRAATPIIWLTGSIAVLAAIGGLVFAASGERNEAVVLIVMAVVVLAVGLVLAGWRGLAAVR
jgi:uncharacterized membrane protein